MKKKIETELWVDFDYEPFGGCQICLYTDGTFDKFIFSEDGDLLYSDSDIDENEYLREQKYRNLF